MSYVGPNLRGTAIRSNDKRVRVATHIPVLQACVNALKPIYVIEHGMGLGSTPYFHSIPSLREIISLEEVDEWKRCETCAQKASSITHTILSFNDIDDVWSRVDLTKTFIFLDGPDAQRQSLFQTAMLMKAPIIVEHDADSFEPERVALVRSVCESNGYLAFQFTGLNPETTVYFRPEIKLELESVVPF